MSLILTLLIINHRHWIKPLSSEGLTGRYWTVRLVRQPPMRLPLRWAQDRVDNFKWMVQQWSVLPFVPGMILHLPYRVEQDSLLSGESTVWWKLQLQLPLLTLHRWLIPLQGWKSLMYWYTTYRLMVETLIRMLVCRLPIRLHWRWKYPLQWH